MSQPRLKPIDRKQSYWGPVDVENLIGQDHIARAIWDLTGRLDLSAFLKNNKAVEGHAGAGRTDPRLLLGVWVYGLTLGIGAARELARRLNQEPGLRWLSGDEEINAHTLSDFRVGHQAALDGLFSQLLAALSEAGMVKLEQLTVDGTKVQAQASGASLRREPRLRERLEQAEAIVKELSQDHSEAAHSKRAAARRRAAAEQQERLQEALQELEEIRKHKPAAERAQARVSVSEPEARVMKNGQGGFALAYNVQSVVDAANKIVMNVAVTRSAGDQQQLTAALERVGPLKPHTQVLVDGGYLTEQSISQAQQQGVELIGPHLEREASRERGCAQSLAQAGIAAEFGPQAFRIVEDGGALECPAGKRLERISKAARHDQYRAQASDCSRCEHGARCCPSSGQRSVKIKRPNPVVEAFHQRMRQPEFAALYKGRGPVAEFPHAWWKEKFRLRKFHVRGLAKVRMEITLAALAYNMQQWVRLIWRPAQPASV